MNEAADPRVPLELRGVCKSLRTAAETRFATVTCRLTQGFGTLKSPQWPRTRPHRGRPAGESELAPGVSVALNVVIARLPALSHSPKSAI